MLRVALSVFTPQEIKALVDEHPDVNFTKVWPSSFPYDWEKGGSLAGVRSKSVDRQRMLDAVEFNLSHDTILEYARSGFPRSADAAALAAAGWIARNAEVAAYGGYSLAEILAHPFNEEADEDLNLEEIKEESGGRHAPNPEDWDWDDDEGAS